MNLPSNLQALTLEQTIQSVGKSLYPFIFAQKQLWLLQFVGRLFLSNPLLWMASPKPFGGGDALTDVPSDGMAHPRRGYTGTMKQVAQSLGATYVDFSASDAQGIGGGGNDGGDEGDDKKASGAGGGDGGDDPEEPSESESENDNQEEEEEEEQEEEDDETKSDTSGDDAKSEPVKEETKSETKPEDVKPFPHEKYIISINFVMSSINYTYVVKTHPKSMWSQVKGAFFCQHPAKMNDRKSFRFVYANENLEDIPFSGSKTLATLNIHNGANVYVSIAGYGGATQGKVKKADKVAVALARCQSTAQRADRNPLPADLLAKAEKLYQEMTNDNSGRYLMGKVNVMTAPQAGALLEGLNDMTMTEKNIPKMLPFFFPEIVDELKAVKDRTGFTIEALESAFVHQFTVCYYSDEKNRYDYSLKEYVKNRLEFLDAML